MHWEQPQVYRRIIDDVIEKVKVDFDEYGIEEDVLINLQAVSCLNLWHSPSSLSY